MTFDNSYNLDSLLEQIMYYANPWATGTKDGYLKHGTKYLTRLITWFIPLQWTPASLSRPTRSVEHGHEIHHDDFDISNPALPSVFPLVLYQFLDTLKLAFSSPTIHIEQLM